jgi:F0F1-type ATP synthase beta subunit
MKEKMMTKNTGKIIQIVGVVIDVEFDSALPAIHDALELHHRS